VSEAALDRIAGDLLRVFERTGVLDHEGDFSEKTLDRPQDRALIREAAASGTVLLSNDGTLPLEASEISSLAVIGPNAYRARVMGGGSAKVAAYRSRSPLDALTERLGASVDVRYARGCNIDRSTPPLSPPLLDGHASVEYFAGHDCEGDVLAKCAIDELSFMALGAPETGVPAEAYSFRAQCKLVPWASGTHEIRLTQCGRARVLIDGELALDASEGDYERGDAFFGMGSVEIVQAVELSAGVPVELVLEYANREAVFLSGASLGIVSLVEEDLIAEAEALAAECDVALVVVGTNDDWETRLGDRRARPRSLRAARRPTRAHPPGRGRQSTQRGGGERRRAPRSRLARRAGRNPTGGLRGPGARRCAGGRAAGRGGSRGPNAHHRARALRTLRGPLRRSPLERRHGDRGRRALRTRALLHDL